MKVSSSIKAGVICVVIGVMCVVIDGSHHLMWICFIWWWSGVIGGYYLNKLFRLTR